MDSLVLSLERLVIGANADLDLHDAPNPEWFAEELRKVYKSYPQRTGNVTVRVTGSDSIEVERSGGTPRVLKVATGSRSWELAASVNASTPGQIAPILANP